VRFYSRADDVIDLGNLLRLTEKDIWKAIEATNIKYQDWTARKERDHGEPVLDIYLEPKPSENISIQECQDRLDIQLSILMPEYADLKQILQRIPLKISFLKPGSFESYMKARQEEGADLAHIKPPHMQPSAQVMERLLEFGAAASKAA
jgi:hypothetical protein